MSRARSDPKARALEVCIQGLQAGVNPEQALAAYPRLADELRPLVWAAVAARRHAAPIQVPELPQEHSQAGFLQITQRMLPRSERPWLKGLVRLAILILLLVIVMAGSAWALEQFSSQALPGSLLYPVKLASERARLALTRQPTQRLARELAQDQERLDEVQALTGHSITAEVDLVDSLEQVENNLWKVGDTLVILPPNAQIKGDIQPGFIVLVHGVLQVDGSIKAQSLQMREYTLVGVIDSIDEYLLVFSGIPIALTPQTLVLGEAAPGVRAQVILRRTADGLFQARLVEALD